MCEVRLWSVKYQGWVLAKITSVVVGKAIKGHVRLHFTHLDLDTSSPSGPRDTSYEGGHFYVDIELEDQYPFVPPKMRFVTKVWHPNVSSANGAICLDILKDQWSPALTLKTALLSLQALLSSPQPDDPQDAVVARQFLTNKDEFETTAKYWTQSFAHETQMCSREQKIKRIVEMGFDAQAAQVALTQANGDENAAMELLLGGS